MNYIKKIKCILKIVVLIFTFLVIGCKSDTKNNDVRKKPFFIKLPNEVLIKSTSNDTVEKYVVNWLENNTTLVDKTTWFNFDRILFSEGSCRLNEESKNQIDNIAKIMTAFPTMEIKIGSYTDSLEVGNDKKMMLSTDRANAVKNYLIENGIVTNRSRAEGYGDEHAVGDNKTDIGRSENRRVAIRITKK
jgi:OmpA-OmpF porin, OOP family